MNSTKTTYNDRFDKAIRFFDTQYHVQKSTFKSYSSLYEQYSSIEKKYASSLMKLTQQISATFELRKEHSGVRQSLGELSSFLQTLSQLHFNFGQRIKQISHYYQSQYSACKTKKDKYMKVLKDHNIDEHQRIKQSKQRELLNINERQVCRQLYEHIDKYIEDEKQRTHRIREQSIVHLSLAKKIFERELELSNKFNSKFIQEQRQIKIPQMEAISLMLIEQHNSYGGERIQQKCYDIRASLNAHNSVTESTIFRQKVKELEQNKGKLGQIQKKYAKLPDQILRFCTPSNTLGLFDLEKFPHYSQYATQIHSDSVTFLCFSMLNGFYANKLDSDIQQLVGLIKCNLKITKQSEIKADTIMKFSQEVKQLNQIAQYNFNILSTINRIYIQDANINTLDSVIKKKNETSNIVSINEVHYILGSVIIDKLLESLITIRQKQPILINDYTDIYKLIIQFGVQYLSISQKSISLLLLRKLSTIIRLTQNTQIQAIELLLSYQNGAFNQKHQQFFKNEACLLLNHITSTIFQFYSHRTPLINLIKILLCLQNIISKFSAMEHLHQCLEIAGYHFLKTNDQDQKLLDTSVWKGEEKLKNLALTLQEIDLDSISKLYLKPAAKQLTTILGVSQPIILAKMEHQFKLSYEQIITCNLLVLKEQEGIDREGYALRLGLFLASRDIMQSKSVNQYNTYFDVLDSYLKATQKQYNEALENSRKTELWIAEENSQATQNCIDFCSLLYKPFEFLLSSLKKLESNKRTPFVNKFSEFIRFRLNTILNDQITKYINFLYNSLQQYDSEQKEISLRPAKVIEPIKMTEDYLNQLKVQYKEITKRLFNLLFLKDQLQQIVSDFIQRDLYEKLGFSIYNTNRLAQESSDGILNNINKIALQIIKAQEKLVKKIAGISVFYFMKDIFNNLYYQEDKNALQQFFGPDYRLSTYTFTHMEKQLQSLILFIQKNIPEDVTDNFKRLFVGNLFLACRSQILSMSKFRIPLDRNSVIDYLNADLNFLSTMLKQRYFDNEMVEKQFDSHNKKLKDDLARKTQKLIDEVEEATLKDNKVVALYNLVLLNLRIKDSKAQDFVKKYKKIALK